MEHSLYRYILRWSAKQQVWLTVCVLASFPFLYAFLEMPKIIVNSALQGKGLDDGLQACAPLLGCGSLPLDALDLGWSAGMEGIQPGRPELLVILCLGLLVLIVINQAFKYYINVYRGLLGERMLRRLRFELFSRVLRFPLPVFRRMSQGEIIPMITQEVEPLGGFIGNAFSLPIFQGGTLIVVAVFLFIQDPIMGLAAVALYPLQAYVVPKLQRKVNAMGKERVRRVRRLSDRIGEVVGGVEDVHVNNTARFELAEYGEQLGGIFFVRYRIYLWKFVIKFVNNFINQLGPVFFYSLGGWFVLQGRLDIGTLLAAIGAHKEMAGPWKELLNYYQQQADARIKYEVVVEQFEPDGMFDPELQLVEPERVPALEGEVVVNNVTLADDLGNTMLENVSLTFETGSHVGFAGPSGGGKEAVAQLVARLLIPNSGSVTIAGHRLDQTPEAVTGRRIGYVGAHAQLFATSVEENLFYGLKHLPMRDAGYEGDLRSERESWFQEADRSGNSLDDINADWIDYTAAGVDSEAALKARALDLLGRVGMEADIYALGLRGSIDPERDPELAAQLLEARAALKERLEDPEIAQLVELFDPEAYNHNATVAENLLFGTPRGAALDMEHIAEHPYVQQVLDQTGLTATLLDRGRQLAETMVELFADLPPGHEFFEQFGFIQSDDLPEFQALLNRVGREGQEMREEDRQRLLALPFKLIPARHRLGLIDEELMAKLLEARRVFAEELPEDLQEAIEFFDPERYNAAASLQDNILFGKIAYGQAESANRVGELIGEVIDSLELRSVVMSVGLQFNVGIGGGRLSSQQRQKIGIARELLKRPDLMILNDALSGFDSATQDRIIAGIENELAERGLVWVFSRAKDAERLSRIFVFRGGKLVEQGTLEELNREGTAYHQVMHA